MTYTNTTAALRVFLASAFVASGLGALIPGGAGASIDSESTTATATARQESLATTTTTMAVDAAAETTIVAETAEQREMVEWGLGRFDEAGLELPAISIYTHSNRADCDGKNGYLGGSAETGWTIHACGVGFTILHELAHAWDRHSLDEETRNEFLKSAHADTWRNTEDWHLSGEEHAANVIAWGLMEERINQKRTRPYDYRSMLDAYETLTGDQPLWLDA